MSHTITRAQLAAVEGANYEAEFRPDYSGRGMYGRSCLGVVADSPILVAFDLAEQIARADNDGDDPDLEDVRDVLEDLGHPRADGMGTSTIWYWPGVQVEDEVTTPA